MANVYAFLYSSKMERLQNEISQIVQEQTPQISTNPLKRILRFLFEMAFFGEGKDPDLVYPEELNFTLLDLANLFGTLAQPNQTFNRNLADFYTELLT